MPHTQSVIIFDWRPNTVSHGLYRMNTSVSNVRYTVPGSRRIRCAYYYYVENNTYQVLLRDCCVGYHENVIQQTTWQSAYTPAMWLMHISCLSVYTCYNFYNLHKHCTGCVYVFVTFWNRSAHTNPQFGCPYDKSIGTFWLEDNIRITEREDVKT